MLYIFSVCIWLKVVQLRVELSGWVTLRIMVTTLCHFCEVEKKTKTRQFTKVELKSKLNIDIASTVYHFVKYFHKTSINSKMGQLWGGVLPSNIVLQHRTGPMHKQINQPLWATRLLRGPLSGAVFF